MSEPSLEFGLALHCGDVTYGNIGVAERPGLRSSEPPRTRTTTNGVGWSMALASNIVWRARSNAWAG
jgi:hypothetical protein